MRPIFAIDPWRRQPNAAVAAARVRIKRRLRRAGVEFDPDLPTHALIRLALQHRPNA